MLISFCIPCMNRAGDLAQAMPFMIAAANASPPVEIVVVDYNSTGDGVQGVCREAGPLVSYVRYEGRRYYHAAHAWNLAVRHSRGEYVTIMGSDAMPGEQFVTVIRSLIARGYIWMRAPHLRGILTCQRQEFMDAGGFDERFELYGGEDKDLENRLMRRGKPFGLVPDGLLDVIRTPNTQKVKNYRPGLTKQQMMRHNSEIRAENDRNETIIANVGVQWGEI